MARFLTLPYIQGIDPEYGSNAKKAHLIIHYNTDEWNDNERAINSDIVYIAMRNTEDANDSSKWCLITPDALDDLITELLYVKQQLSEKTVR